MAITVDWGNKIVNSTSNITDVIALRTTLRDLEMSETGILYSPIITYKLLDLGGGAYFPSIEFINGYSLKFPNAGNYVIKGGNIKATIEPVTGVYVNQTQSAAYSVTSAGGGGATAEQIREEMDTNSTELAVIKAKVNMIPGLF